MKKLLAVAAGIGLGCSWAMAEPQAPNYKKVVLSDVFYAEGSACADINRDGKLDVVAGPYWYEGPDFTNKHEIYTPKAYKPAPEYSDNFLTLPGDFNGDGLTDLFVVGFPGAAAYWLENPGTKGGHWTKRLAFKQVASENPVMADLFGDGKQRPVFVSNGYVGWGEPDPSGIDKPWLFHPVTPKGGYNGHGTGVGDINGDGRLDILEAGAWWEQPANGRDGQPWIKHAFNFGPAPANMLVYDVDGDGKNDVITALHCHLYGISWFQQVKDEKGGITFKQHVIVGQKPEDNPQGIRFSQAHAFELADLNGDGAMDFITGKRRYAHGDHGDVEPGAPSVLYWFELVRDKEKGAHYVGHLLDDSSGVGLQVNAVDLNGDKVPDIIVSNKNGTFLFMSQSGK